MAPEGGLRFRFAKRSERAQSANSFSPEGSKFIVLNTGVKPLISPKFGSKGTRETKTSSRPSPTQKFKVRITGLNKIEVPIRNPSVRNKRWNLWTSWNAGKVRRAPELKGGQVMINLTIHLKLAANIGDKRFEGTLFMPIVPKEQLA